MVGFISNATAARRIFRSSDSSVGFFFLPKKQCNHKLQYNNRLKRTAARVKYRVHDMVIFFYFFFYRK